MTTDQPKSLFWKHPGAWLQRHMDVVSHVAPFIAWLGLMMVLEMIGPAHAWKYAVRTGSCAALFVALRPWRYYSGPRWRDLPWGILVGVVVLGIWVLPEIRGKGSPFLLQTLYLNYGTFPLGRAPEMLSSSIYAPETAGWALALVRLTGSALVIAVIEEFFWRGFLYRWLIERRFLRLPLSEWDGEAFLIMIVLFGVEHNRWLAGMAAGALYGLLMLRTRSIWSACIAHIVTNLLLGIYVLQTGSYGFW